MAEKDAPKSSAKVGTARSSAGSKRDGSGPRAGAVLAVALALLLVGWLVLRSGGDDDGESAAASAAEVVSADELRAAAEDSETPIYWAGPREGAAIELTRPDSERTFVRYLPEGAEAGDPRSNFLTVGTYVYPGAIAALRKLAKKPGGELASAPGGATLYFNRHKPQNVYLAYPGEDVQIEVYDPNGGRALRVASSGQIVPVD